METIARGATVASTIARCSAINADSEPHSTRNFSLPKPYLPPAYYFLLSFKILIHFLSFVSSPGAGWCGARGYYDDENFEIAFSRDTDLNTSNNRAASVVATLSTTPPPPCTITTLSLPSTRASPFEQNDTTRYSASASSDSGGSVSPSFPPTSCYALRNISYYSRTNNTLLRHRAPPLLK